MLLISVHLPLCFSVPSVNVMTVNLEFLCGGRVTRSYLDKLPSLLLVKSVPFAGVYSNKCLT